MDKTKKIVFASMFAAVVCVATMIIKIPSPLKGYVNLGDCMVLISGWLLGPLYGFFAAAIGSSLADIISGYIIYAPVTFIIKGIMAAVAFFISNKIIKNGTISKVFSAFVAELIMVCCYYVFEGFLYGFVSSAVNILPNAVQGIVGIILGTLIIRVIEVKNIDFF